MEKKTLSFTPERIGLAQKDILYLYVLKQLRQSSNHPGALYRVLREQFNHDTFLKSRAHFYNTFQEMEKFGWVEYSSIGNKKVYFITQKGKETFAKYEKEHYHKIKDVHELSDFLYKKFTGKQLQEPPQLSNDAMKLFNRLIRVKPLVVYLFLKILHIQQRKDPWIQWNAKQIQNEMITRYGWSCSSSYLYEVAHMMEDKGGWIEGQWKGKRRTEFTYLLTERGERFLPLAAEEVIHDLKECIQFLSLVIKLFTI